MYQGLRWREIVPSIPCLRESRCDVSGDSDELPITGDTVTAASSLPLTGCVVARLSVPGDATSPISMIVSSVSWVLWKFLAKIDERSDMPRFRPRGALCIAPVGLPLVGDVAWLPSGDRGLVVA